MSDTHRYVGDHAAEVSGVMRAPGEFVTLTKEQEADLHNQDMIDSGTLLALDVVKGGEKTDD